MKEYEINDSGPAGVPHPIHAGTSAIGNASTAKPIDDSQSRISLRSLLSEGAGDDSAQLSIGGHQSARNNLHLITSIPSSHPTSSPSAAYATNLPSLDIFSSAPPPQPSMHHAYHSHQSHPMQPPSHQYQPQHLQQHPVQITEPTSASISSSQEENQPPQDPNAKKKKSHKDIERRRREAINDGIKQIADLIPRERVFDFMRNKSAILYNGAKYIRDLQAQEKELKSKILHFQTQNQTLAKENYELRMKLYQLQNSSGSTNINNPSNH